MKIMKFTNSPCDNDKGLIAGEEGCSLENGRRVFAWTEREDTRFSGWSEQMVDRLISHQHCSGLHLPLLHRTIGNGPWEDGGRHEQCSLHRPPLDLRQCVRRGRGRRRGIGILSGPTSSYVSLYGHSVSLEHSSV